MTDHPSQRGWYNQRITITGCHEHARTDCGCPGYPSLQQVLRDCGNDCANLNHPSRCIRCQAAQMIDRLQTRNSNYLDRILELQTALEHTTAATGTIWIQLPVTTVEQIATTGRIFPALDVIRDAILTTWFEQP